MIVLDGTTGISTPAEAVAGNLSYTGTLTGGAGVVNLGSGQVYKDASGNVGIGTSSPNNASAGRTVLELNNSSNTLLNMSVNGTRYGGIYTDTSAATFGAFANIPVVWVTNNTERARIDSSGNLLVGTTTGGASRIYAEATNAGWSYTSNQTGSGTFYHMIFRVAGTAVGNIDSTSTTTSYRTSSDYRLKNTITPMNGALAKVAALKPVTYKWNSDGSDGQGFIAHELQEVVPDCVSGEKDAVDADGNPQYQGIDTSFLVATLTAAIQELKILVDTQAARITALEAQIV